MSATTEPPRITVGLAGASGFVGTHLIEALSASCKVRGLSRSANVVAILSVASPVEWRRCDLYSEPKVTEVLQGCDCAIYLVHSMAPSSRLVQGSFEDTDLLLADNFIRAAEAAGVRHVIYLSGLMPTDCAHLSPHLRSRLEVEKVLRSSRVQVTVLRAGLIFGPGGSSFSLLVNLVRRLPVMLLPAWAQSTTHSIDIKNVCQAIELCLHAPELAGGIYDLGGHEPMTYREMIEQTAWALGRRTRFITFPFNCFGLSKQWVAFFGRVPKALVGPLQESLQHDLVARPNPLLERMRGQMVGFADSLARSVDAQGYPKPNPRSHTQPADLVALRKARRVRSVQRMVYPEPISAPQVAAEYARWLTRRFRGLIASIHEFAPTLPWWIYAATQARLHLRVMRGFARHLRECRVAADEGLGRAGSDS